MGVRKHEMAKEAWRPLQAPGESLGPRPPAGLSVLRKRRAEGYRSYQPFRAHPLEAGRLLYRLVESRFFSHHPLVLSHLITGKCNCRCETCLWWGDYGEELTTGEVAALYGDAAECGLVMNVLWGGEPLLRDDISEILYHSKKNGLVTTLITNGYFLPDRADELRDVDSLIVSTDLPSEEHDRLRKCPGVFRKALAGMEEMRRRYPKTKIMLNSVVSKLNVQKIPELIFLARELGISIYLSPMETGAKPTAQPSPKAPRSFVSTPDRPPRPAAAPKAHLALDETELASVCELAIRLKRQSYPVNNSFGYLRTFIPRKKPYVCHARKVYLHVNPNGDIENCLQKEKPLANVRRQPLREILRDREYKRLTFAPTSCHICNNADVIDCSYIWQLRPESLLAYLRLYFS